LTGLCFRITNFLKMRTATSKLLPPHRPRVLARGQRLEGAGGTLKLEHLEALRGLVLAAAVRRLRTKQDTFRLFGKEATVSNRNHSKVLRAEIARVAALCEALGQPADPTSTR
jgi:hypothetical protein